MTELLLCRQTNSWRIKDIQYRERLSSEPGRLWAGTFTAVSEFSQMLWMNSSRFSVKVNSGYP